MSEVRGILPRNGCEIVQPGYICRRKKVKELQDRVCHDLTVVIADDVTAKNEEISDEVIVKAARVSSGISRTCLGLLRDDHQLITVLQRHPY